MQNFQFYKVIPSKIESNLEKSFALGSNSATSHDHLISSLSNLVVIHSAVMSIPAVIPALLQIFPSTVHRPFISQLTPLGAIPNLAIVARENLFVIALLPSSSPAFASAIEPVHMERMLSTSSYLEVKNSARPGMSGVVGAWPGIRR